MIYKAIILFFSAFSLLNAKLPDKMNTFGIYYPVFRYNKDISIIINSMNKEINTQRISVGFNLYGLRKTISNSKFNSYSEIDFALDIINNKRYGNMNGLNCLSLSLLTGAEYRCFQLENTNVYVKAGFGLNTSYLKHYSIIEAEYNTCVSFVIGSVFLINSESQHPIDIYIDFLKYSSFYFHEIKAGIKYNY